MATKAEQSSDFSPQWADSNDLWPDHFFDADRYTNDLLAVHEEAAAALGKVEQNQDLTPEAKQRLTGEAMAALRAKEGELDARWDRRLADLEALAGKQARPSKAHESDSYQLAQSNGLTMLSIMAQTLDAKGLQAELEQVAARAIPGEVFAWAKALPGIIKQKTAGNVNARMASPIAAVEGRCEELLEGLKSPKQRSGEANLRRVRELQQTIQHQRSYRQLERQTNPTGGGYGSRFNADLARLRARAGQR